ncbi:Uncharacterized protein APZ42_015237 [Daphnia magna]|uniref:Uncharacterized protein n=1 Tax=Daphnia magna TaxID=35525 RepID=A0A162PAG7_9CRUS|nr:Uncharacterized protein APZ42_015237 [Daphnia magna]
MASSIRFSTMLCVCVYIQTHTHTHTHTKSMWNGRGWRNGRSAFRSTDETATAQLSEEGEI